MLKKRLGILNQTGAITSIVVKSDSINVMSSLHTTSVGERRDGKKYNKIMIKQIGILVAMMLVNGCVNEPPSPTPSTQRTSTISTKQVPETFESLRALKLVHEGKSMVEALSLVKHEASRYRSRCNFYFGGDDPQLGDLESGRGYQGCLALRNQYLEMGININDVDDYINMIMDPKLEGWGEDQIVGFSYAIVSLSLQMKREIYLFAPAFLNTINKTGEFNTLKLKDFLSGYTKRDVNIILSILEKVYVDKTCDHFQLSQTKKYIITQKQIKFLRQFASSLSN
jgi:hypothetical protein